MELWAGEGLAEGPPSRRDIVADHSAPITSRHLKREALSGQQ